MTERGILFSAPMVRALLDGSKTQTRRAVKPAVGAERHSPYGQPGDRLWVRETFFAYGRWETRYNEKKQRPEWRFVDMTSECNHIYRYAADNPELPLASGRSTAPAWHTRPALFMPRVASRILLEIVSVRTERLQDIGEADARAEGTTQVPEQCAPDDEAGLHAYRLGYRALWERINGVGSWDGNPWVWVVEFRRI